MPRLIVCSRNTNLCGVVNEYRHNNDPTLAPETRILFSDVPYHIYDTLIEAVSPHSPVRMAYDGKDLEIMTKGTSHEGFRWLIDPIIRNVAGMAGFRIKGLGETTWKRPDIDRGIEADQCYFLTDEKIDQVAAALRRRSENLADYPAPDLVVEIDISPPLADREAIYAAMRVPSSGSSTAKHSSSSTSGRTVCTWIPTGADGYRSPSMR